MLHDYVNNGSMYIFSECMPMSMDHNALLGKCTAAIFSVIVDWLMIIISLIQEGFQVQQWIDNLRHAKKFWSDKENLKQRRPEPQKKVTACKERGVLSSSILNICHTKCIVFVYVHK